MIQYTNMQRGKLKTIFINFIQDLSLIVLLLLQVGSVFISPALVYYVMYHTRFWWMCLLYISWYLTMDWEMPDRRSEWLRDWKCWVHAKNYYSLKIVKLPWGELDPKRNYLFCYFPHGLFSAGAFLTLATNATNFSEYFPYHKPYLHTISMFFKLPFMREVSYWLGGISASRESLNYVLSKPEGGNVSGLVVGGADEAYYSKPGLHKLVYRKRKGFVKIALRNGSPLVPVYCFGETELYSQLEVNNIPLIRSIQSLTKKVLGFVMIFPIGRGIFQNWFGLLPYRRSLTVVVGEPMEVEKCEEPTQDQIDDLHARFEKKLIELFERQKKYYIDDYENAHLEIS